MARRKGGSVPKAENPARSVRVDDPTWDKAVRRAVFEGTTISTVVQRFVKGYAEGLINAPRMQLVCAAPRSGGSPPTATPEAAAMAADTVPPG